MLFEFSHPTTGVEGEQAELFILLFDLCSNKPNRHDTQKLTKKRKVFIVQCSGEDGPAPLVFIRHSNNHNDAEVKTRFITLSSAPPPSFGMQQERRK